MVLPRVALGSRDPRHAAPGRDLHPDEQAKLAPHFTNLDLPVFALVNLPETVKGALFARYSRYQGTLRRLFLDEFADSVPEIAGDTSVEGERAAKLYETIFLGYGDDSVAQLGGAHVACEWVSNVMTKVLQRPRIGAYLEQSTRYIAYDAPDARAAATATTATRSSGPEYERAMDEIFSIYAASLPRVIEWADAAFPAPDGEPSAAHRRAITAKALDLLRGLLPAASLSHMGIYASRPDLRAADPPPARPPAARGAPAGPLDPRRGQGRDAVVRHARGAPGPRRRVGQLPRGARARRRALGRAPGPRPPARRGDGPTARRSSCCTSTATRTRCWPRSLFEAAGADEETVQMRLAALSRGGGASCSPTSSASAPTAATAPAAAGRRCATASRSSRTTARSATCSATAC